MEKLITFYCTINEVFLATIIYPDLIFIIMIKYNFLYLETF